VNGDVVSKVLRVLPSLGVENLEGGFLGQPECPLRPGNKFGLPLPCGQNIRNWEGLSLLLGSDGLSPRFSIVNTVSCNDLINGAAELKQLYNCVQRGGAMNPL
jgi:hypothetical protein